MDLSLELIRDKLKNRFKIKDYKDQRHEMSLGRLLFYRAGNICDTDRLYVLPTPAPDGTILPEEGAYVLSGDSKAAIANFQQLQNYILLEETEDLYEAINSINQIYDLYDRWEQENREILIHAGSAADFKTVVNHAERVFENPVSIVDSDYCILGMSAMAGEQETYRQANKYGDYVPSEIIDCFRNNKQFRDYYHSPVPYIFEDNYFPFRGLTKNIIKDGKMYCRIIISETNRPFRDSDFPLLEKLAELAELLIEKLEMGEERKGRGLKKLFRQMIDDSIYDRKILEEELSGRGWETDDRYQVIYMEPSETDIAITVLKRIAEQFARIFSDTESFIAEDHMIVVVNLSHLADTRDSLFGSIAVFIRDNNFRAGISNLCCNVHQIRTCYHQAVLALELGRKRNRQEWIHRFADCILPYMYRKVTEEFDPDELLSPVFVRLQDYDRRNNTEYIKTLKCLFDNHMNASKTAESLFIHRATIVFRIKRICEIGQTDLKNSRDFLHLAISFYLARQARS